MAQGMTMTTMEVGKILSGDMALRMLIYGYIDGVIITETLFGKSCIFQIIVQQYVLTMSRKANVTLESAAHSRAHEEFAL